MSPDLPTIDRGDRPRKPGVVVALTLIAASIAVGAWGLVHDPQRVWANLLVDGFFLLSLAISALFFLAAQRLTGARWSAGLRRVPEALMMLLPLAAVGMLALYFGRGALYTWADGSAVAAVAAVAAEHGTATAGRDQYLTVPGVFGRSAATFILWTACAWRLRRLSLMQDRNPADSLSLHNRLNRGAAGFVALFVPTFTFTAYDWLISLEPHWFSTMFAVYVFAGTFVQGIAAVTLLSVWLQASAAGSDAVGEQQLADLGKMLFAFSIFWAYIWVCQYLLIWYGNIPEEVTYYVRRTHGPWLPLFAANFVVNWVVPFTALLSARAKRRPRLLAMVAGAVLLGRWLDLYVMVMPARFAAPPLGLYEVALAAGYGALCFLLFVRNFRGASPVPLHDPVLAYRRRHAALHL